MNIVISYFYFSVTLYFSLNICYNEKNSGIFIL